MINFLLFASKILSCQSLELKNSVSLRNYRYSINLSSFQEMDELRIRTHCKALLHEISIPSHRKTVNKDRYGDWYMNYWDSTWSCPLETKVQKVLPGQSFGDGSKWICDLHVIPHEKCLVYSFGSRGDYSFERGVFDLLGCEIHVFDPFSGYIKGVRNFVEKRSNDHSAFKVENRDIKYKNSPLASIFPHRWGLAETDKIINITRKKNSSVAVMKSLPSIIKELKHTNRSLDILKIDIEGCEFGILDNENMWKELDDLGLIVNQLLVEVHFQGVNKTTFKWISGPRYTGQQMDQLLRVISNQGFAMFHKTVNSYSAANSIPCEYAFVNIGKLQCTK